MFSAESYQALKFNMIFHISLKNAIEMFMKSLVIVNEASDGHIGITIGQMAF